MDEGVVNYLGPSVNVEAEIAQADCMIVWFYHPTSAKVHPSHCLKAGAMGKPIVITDYVDCREAVDDRYIIFYFEPNSSESLKSSLNKIIILSHKERLKLESNIRLKIESKFDEIAVIEKYLKAIKP